MRRLPRWGERSVVKWRKPSEGWDEWPNRLEGIAYDLQTYHGDDPHTHRRIVETIAKLPDRVARFALNRCVYFSAGRVNHGMVLPPRTLGRGRWVLVLTETTPERSAQSMIAHEIAHAWLKHDRYAANVDAAEIESGAAQLAREWGFSGRAADPDYQRRLHSPMGRLAPG
jgi:hypothetical protein